jgi:hypothetical protein
MYNITLICTVHKENGNCNLNELYKIIETINPEIIFEEIPSFKFDAYYKEQSISTLETDAIKKYLQKYQIEHVPVDNYDLSDIHFEDVDYMSEQKFNSIEYCNLLNEQLLRIRHNGFTYLNNNQCSETFEKLHILEENILKNINDEKLFCIYKLWSECIDKRECEMINNIYSYCKEHSFNRGLFLIGAGHRRSIINKIEKYEVTGSLKLNWNYSNYDNLV